MLKKNLANETHEFHVSKIGLLNKKVIAKD